MADNTPAKHLEPYKWQKGVSANPAGRPKGSRNKLAEDFLSDVLAEWENHGAVALSDMREKNPGDFVKMVAGLLPKEMTLNLNSESDLSDDELLAEIRKLHASLAPFLAEGMGETAGAEQSAQLH